MVTAVGVPVEDSLADVGTNARRVVFCLERDCKADFIRSLGQLSITHIVNQSVECLTRPSSWKQVLNIDFLILILRGIKRNNINPDPDIKSWSQPVKDLKYMVSMKYNLKGSFLFYPYRFPDGLGAFSTVNIQRGWKYYQGVFHNTYHVGNI